MNVLSPGEEVERGIARPSAGGCIRRTMAAIRPLLVLAASLAVAPAAAQEVVEIPRQLGCRGCAIEVERIAVLGEEDGPGIIESDATEAAVDSRGRYFLFHAYAPYVKVFDARGRYVKTLGAEGQGPGEFRGVGIVRVSAGDTIHVFDSDNSTHSIFSPSLSFLRSHRLDFLPQLEAVALDANRAVVAVPIRTPARVGFPLHLVDRGRIVRSFGSERGAFRPDIPYFDDRTIAPAGPGRIWSAHRNRYHIELWSTDGRKLRELRRSVDWFRPHASSGFASPSTPPAPLLQQVWQDRAGRLWVRTVVADPNWRRAVQRGGPHGYTVQDYDGYRDTVIEVIDPQRGRVLASRRFPMMVDLLGEDRLGTVMTGPDDVPRYVVWRLRLSTPSPRRSR